MTDPAVDRFGTLPYGPTFNRLLPKLYDAFLAVNRWYTVPAIRLGLGPLHTNPLTGAFVLLRTRGRKSGVWREIPLGYTILGGCVYVTAGFGERTQWYRNILADPKVEVVLPGGAFAGIAETVTDPGEWVRGYRQLVRDLGVIGRLTVADYRTVSDDELRSKAAGLPLIRVRLTGIAPGPMDPGGWGWAVPTALSVAWLARAALRRRTRGPAACAACGHATNPR